MKRSLEKVTIKELASIVGSQLKKHGINAVLTGGACVTIYSHNKYQSLDLDFVSNAVEYKAKEISQAMQEIGFKMEDVGIFEREDCPFFIEFIGPPLAVGREPVKEIKTLRTKYGSFKILSPTDCVKDRLGHFFHWNDPQALEQVKMVANKHKIDFKEIKRWAKAENQLEKYNSIIGQIRQ